LKAEKELRNTYAKHVSLPFKSTAKGRCKTQLFATTQYTTPVIAVPQLLPAESKCHDRKKDNLKRFSTSHA